MSTAYHQVVLTPETPKLVHSVVGNVQNEYKLYWWRTLPVLFTHAMGIFFAPLDKKENKLSHLFMDLIEVDNKTQVFDRFRIFHDTEANSEQEPAPAITIFFQPASIFLARIHQKLY